MSRIKGYVQLSRWTPANAARAARGRIEKIELLLQEIGCLYGDVYEPVVDECDALIASLRGEGSLDRAIQEALDEGRTL